MKNGIYIETFDKIENCKVHYRDNIIRYAEHPNGNKKYILQTFDSPILNDIVEWSDGNITVFLNGEIIKDEEKIERYRKLIAFQ